MSTNKGICLVIMAFFSHTVMAESVSKDLIDKEKIKAEKSARKECADIFNFSLQVECKMKAEERYASKIRGKKEFAIANYKRMKSSELQNKLTELEQLREIARPWGVVINDGIPGEITKENIENEIFYVLKFIRDKSNSENPLAQKKRTYIVAPG